MTKELIDLFIELDKLEESMLKKAVSIVRQKLEEGGIGTAVEVIDIDNPKNYENNNENGEIVAVDDIAIDVIKTGTVSTHHPITTDHQQPSTQSSKNLEGNTEVNIDFGTQKQRTQLRNIRCIWVGSEWRFSCDNLPSRVGLYLVSVLGVQAGVRD